MPQVRHIPNFRFPNFHPNANGGSNPENTCEVIMAASDDMSRLDVLMVQQRGEWQRGTSAINQAEVIATQLVNDIFPALYRDYPALRSAQVNWYVQVVTDHPELSRIQNLQISFNWPPRWQRTWLWEKIAGRQPVTLEHFDFNGSVDPATLLVRIDN